MVFGLLSPPESCAVSLPQDVLRETGQDTVKLGRDIRYRQGKADAYIMIARLEKENGNLTDALHYYLSAIYELEILDDRIKTAEVQIHTGDIFLERALYEKALEYYQGAEEKFRTAGIHHEQDTLFIRIGRIYLIQDNFEPALQYFEQASRISRQKNADSLEVYARHRMVECYLGLKQYEKAIGMNESLLSYYTTLGDINKQILLLNNTGYLYRQAGDLDAALNYFNAAASLEMQTRGTIRPVTLVNQAVIYQNQGDDTRALATLHEASRQVEKLNDKRQASEYYYLTALVYFNLEDYHNALLHVNSTIRMEENTGYSTLLEKAYLLSSRIYEALFNYEEAMVQFQHHLSVRDSLQRIKLFDQQQMNRALFTVEEITRETERLRASEELSYLELQRLKLDSANREQELEILYQSDSIQRITIENQRLENLRTQQALLLREEQLFAARKAKEVDSLRLIEENQQLELETQRLIQQEQENEIVLLDQKNKIAELEIRKVRTRNMWLVVFGVLALIIIYGVVRGLRFARRTNTLLIKQNNEIERQRDEIDYERQRSDKLLLNILPEETAEELKEKGSATPRHYPMVSVLFTDFKGFTNIAEKLTPEALVEELNQCFLAFDKIIDAHNLEKIKTIGDAYMCAGGIPVANETNPFDIVRAGLQIKDYMERLKAEREARGEDFWELRIGIHTGPVVAGVVGKNKFAYDIWGDAVNTASRMESSGIPGKVNISGATHALIRDRFRCTYRGKIKAKNKGEIDMYIVEGELND